jgi:hypothetical protein
VGSTAPCPTTRGDGRLFSSYNTAEHGKIWIITNAIRGEGEGPIRTVLFPDDY